MGKQIRCRSAADAERDRGKSAGVLSVKADRNCFEIQVNAAEPVVRELLQRDAWLADLEVTNAGLEEAFLALTQNYSTPSMYRTGGTNGYRDDHSHRPGRCPSTRCANWIDDLRQGSEVRSPENMRMPIYAFSTVLFPVMFYVLFGIVLPSGSGATRAQNATYMLATMACYGVMGVRCSASE